MECLFVWMSRCGVVSRCGVGGAIRDEGLSYQYVPADRIIYADQDLTQRISCYLSRKNIPHIKGLTWTTDAVFRENKKRISRRKKEGALIVEMERKRICKASTPNTEHRPQNERCNGNRLERL